MFITLITPNNEENADISIIEDEACGSIITRIKYKGKDICGYSKGGTLPEAFAEMQKQLPEDIIIKSCLTCRHGNTCPFNSCDDEFFCTKDINITCKNDMCDLFCKESEGEMEKRLRYCTDSCEDFQQQSEDCYTYNVYLFFLNDLN
ncbi:MAG: hypothetical protein J6C03_05950 [Clostridia bacterium]|nr:hypothetical protein [Clostridia bacterium]